MPKQSPLDLFIAEIQLRAEFPALVDLLSAGRPIVPDYDPVSGNTELWKHKSGMKQGYDLCLALLRIELEK